MVDFLAGVAVGSVGIASICGGAFYLGYRSFTRHPEAAARMMMRKIRGQ